MKNYFLEFILEFVGINGVIAEVVATIIAITLMIAILYLLTKIVFPNDSIIKRVVWCAIFIASIIAVLVANGINPITIMQILPEMGVSA